MTVRNLSPWADPHPEKSAKADLILSATDGQHCLVGQECFSADKDLRFIHTIFGWTAVGTTPTSETPAAMFKMSVAAEESADKLLKKLWELQAIPEEDSPLMLDEQSAVAQYKDSYTRLPSGQYSVSLPRRSSIPELGNSRPTALCRFLQNERILTPKGQWDSFNTGLEEYVTLDHAELVPPSDLDKPVSQTFYFPMHGVIKESSMTTRLRIVFDESAKSTSGVSLNDQLLAGPSMYPSLSSVVSQFRCHVIAITGDISKMFRGILLNPEERDHHRFLRHSLSGTIQDWRMKCLTFGVASSPYLATQVLHQAASDLREKYPLAADTIVRSFYVDDCLTGASTVDDPRILREKLCQLLQEVGLTLRKWRSNSTLLLDSIPEDLKEKSPDVVISADPTVYGKTLGIHWNTQTD